MDSILIPVDLSETTPVVIAAAKDVARSRTAKLYLIHVASLTAPAVATEFGPIISRVDLATTLRQEHRDVHALAKKLKSEGYDASASLMPGDPVQQILREARRRTAHLIVIGSHGHGALYHLLMGSTVTGVLRRAPCPVLVVPAKIAIAAVASLPEASTG
jgi:nucleotide-binding universal stress UspA family protein